MTSYRAYGSSLYANYYGNVYDSVRVHVAYQAIYFLATLEILALSLFLLFTKSKRGLSGKVSAHRTATIASVGRNADILQAMIWLVALVAVPGLIRAIFLLAFTAASDLEGLDIPIEAFAAEDFIIGALQMVVYVGIILTVVTIAKSSAVNAAPTGDATGPTMTEQPAAVPSQYQQPYQQQPYYAPQTQYQNGQEVKPYNAGSPPPQQAYYPPPQHNGYPQQNGYPQPQAGYPQQNGVPPQGATGYQQPYGQPPQQPYQAPMPQQYYQGPPQQPAVAQTGPSPVSNPTPPQNANQPIQQHNQPSSELPPTHY